MNKLTFCDLPTGKLTQFGKPACRRFKGKTVEACTCSECGYVFFEPPSDSELEDYYINQYGKNWGLANWYSVQADYDDGKVKSRAHNAVSLLKSYLHSVPRPVLLEVGCAFGGTVSELRKQGYTAYGADLNADAIQQGRQRGNEFIFADYAHNVMRNAGVKANLVFSYHALEHMPDPVAFLVSLKDCLADDAVLEFRVPNGTYLKAWLEGFESWNWFAYPDHLHMFTARSVLCLADRAGFEVLSISSRDIGDGIQSIQRRMGLDHGEGHERLLSILLQNSLLLQELRFVLCLKDSTTAKYYQRRSEMAHTECVENTKLEVDLKLISGSINSANS